MFGAPNRWTLRALAAIALLIAGCGATSSPPGTAPPDYRTALCGGLVGIGRTAPDFKIFLGYLNEVGVREGPAGAKADALAALARITERTGKAIDDLEAAGRLWEPGADAAERMAAMSRDLMPILAEYKAFMERPLVESLMTADAHYNEWIDNGPKVDAVLADLDRLGVACT